MASAKKVLVPIANGSEDIESVTIIDVLRRAGAEVTVASVEETLDVKFSWGIKVQADALIKDVAAHSFDLIVIPGGMPGSERLRDSAPLAAMLKAQAAEQKPYAAMCAAPAVVLESQGLLAGKAATAHPAWTAKLANGGGASVEGRVIVDGNVATSRGPGTALEFGLALVDMLYGEEKVKDLAGKMVVNWPQAKKVPKEWTMAH